MVALADRAGAQRFEIGSATGFGHRNRTDQRAGRHPGQPTVLLLFGAVGQDVVRDQPAVDLVAESAFAAGGLGFEDREVMGQRAAAATVVLRDRRTQQTEFSCLVPELAVHTFLRRPPLSVG